MTRERAICVHSHFYQPPRPVRTETRRPSRDIPSEACR